LRNSSNGPALAIIGLAIWSGAASAAEDSAALRCAAIGDDLARLACYDGIFRGPQGSGLTVAAASGAAGGAAAQPGATPTVAAPAAAAPADPVADFGMTPARKESIEAAQAKAAGSTPAPKAPVGPDSITARVATVAHRQTGELVVILDDGQVWVQIDTEAKARVKEGEEVTIRKGTLGSYFLVTPSHILVRVRRVK
jgi:hypothetical protein